MIESPLCTFCEKEDESGADPPLRGGEIGEFSPPSPLFLSPLLSFFSYPSNIEIIFDFSDIITKIHRPFQNPGSAPVESLEHLLFHCTITVKNFWLASSSWINKQNISMETLTLNNILFGVFNHNEDFAILNHLILIAKCYIEQN